MAELFGTLASAIGIVGVAAQCADGIKKLREFQRDVKNASQEIEVLIEQLDVLSETVRSIGVQIQKSVGGFGGVSSVGAVDMVGPLKLCCNGVESTAAVIRDLNAEIKVRRKRGTLKAAWRKKEIEEYMGRVERCKSALALAYSAFARELQHQEFTMITGRLDQMQNTVVTFTQTSTAMLVFPSQAQGTAPADMSDQEQEKRNDILIRRDSYGKWGPPIRVAKFAFSLPYWLLGRSLEIEILRSTKGWTFNLNPQRVVPRDSVLFNACKYDTFTTVRSLVTEGKASVQDVCPAGWSVSDVLLFHIGLNVDAEEHLKMLEFTIDNGAMSTKHTHIQCYTWTSTRNTRLDDVMSMTLHKVVDKLEADMSVERLREAIRTYGKIPSQFVFSVFNTYVQWSDLPLTVRLKALSLDFVTSTSPIDLEAWINVESFGKIKTDCSPEIYHQLIELLGRSIGESLALGDRGEIQRWHEFLSHVLEQCGDKRECLEYTGVAAFRYLVEGIHYRDWREISGDLYITHESIQEFAQEFRALGAELVKFGESLRKALVTDMTELPDGTLKWWDMENRLALTRIVALEVGSEPKDWRIWLSDARADAVVDVFEQFWNMVENPEVAMPGAWVFEEEQRDVYGWLRSTDHLFETESYHRLRNKEERRRDYRRSSGRDSGNVEKVGPDTEA